MRVMRLFFFNIRRKALRAWALALIVVFSLATSAIVETFVEIGMANSVAIAASSSSIKRQDELDLSDKDFSGQSLIQKELTSLDLAGANFSDSDLRGAVFNGVNLHDSNLRRADLSDAMLYVTDLTDADLTEANLNSTMLLKTRLDGATIEGADFTYATIDRDQLFKLCKYASGTNPVTGVDTRESLECP